VARQLARPSRGIRAGAEIGGRRDGPPPRSSRRPCRRRGPMSCPCRRSTKRDGAPRGRGFSLASTRYARRARRPSDLPSATIASGVDEQAGGTARLDPARCVKRGAAGRGRRPLGVDREAAPWSSSERSVGGVGAVGRCRFWLSTCCPPHRPSKLTRAPRGNRGGRRARPSRFAVRGRGRRAVRVDSCPDPGRRSTWGGHKPKDLVEVRVLGQLNRRRRLIVTCAKRLRRRDRRGLVGGPSPVVGDRSRRVWARLYGRSARSFRPGRPAADRRKSTRMIVALVVDWPSASSLSLSSMR